MKRLIFVMQTGKFQVESVYYKDFSMKLYIVLLLLVISANVGMADEIHFDTVDSSVFAAIEAVYAESDYNKALVEAEKIIADQGDKLIDQGQGRLYTVKERLATSRNRLLNQDELKIYQARYDSIAKKQFDAALKIADIQQQSYQLREIARNWPASSFAVLALDSLAQCCYQQGNFAEALTYWTDCLVLLKQNPASLAESEIQARILLCRWNLGIDSTQLNWFQLTFSDLHNEQQSFHFAPINKTNGLFYSIPAKSKRCQEENSSSYSIKSSLTEFQNKYPAACGIMAGQSVLLADFLAAQFANSPPPSDTSVLTKSPFYVDKNGIWISDQSESQPKLIYEDTAADSVKQMYIGTYDNAIVNADGLLFARIGTPETWININKRPPLELGNKIVCLNTFSQSVLWEKAPENSMARWTAPFLYYHGKLYALEIQNGNSVELTAFCLDAASGQTIWKQTLYSQTTDQFQKQESDYRKSAIANNSGFYLSPSGLNLILISPTGVNIDLDVKTGKIQSVVIKPKKSSEISISQ